MTDRCLAIRADAGTSAGAGHVMRSLALADAWQRSGGAVEWFSSEMPPMLADLIAARGITQHRLASAERLGSRVRMEPASQRLLGGR